MTYFQYKMNAADDDEQGEVEDGADKYYQTSRCRPNRSTHISPRGGNETVPNTSQGFPTPCHDEMEGLPNVEQRYQREICMGMAASISKGINEF